MLDNLLLLVVAMFLVVLNGFFVAAEFALVKLRQTQVSAIALIGGFRGKMLAKVYARLDSYLSACQLGITLASLGLGWVGEPAFAKILQPLLSQLNVTTPSVLHAISFFCAFFTISFLHIVVGELAPKSLAIRLPEKISLWTATPLYLFYWIMYPLIWILNFSANIILKIFGLSGNAHHENNYTTEEIKLILNKSNSSDILTDDEWQVMAHTLDFSDLDVSDLMRPIGEAAALFEGKSLAENLNTISEHRYSRYPYFAKDQENVLGLVHVKDLFLAQESKNKIINLSNHLRKIECVPPNMPAPELLRRFRKGAPHFALVGYPGQKPIGFLTLDNLLSALVGHIHDEFRQNEQEWKTLADGSLLGKGSLPLYSLERLLGIDIPNEQEADSIGGLVIDTLGDLPKEGQMIVCPQFNVEILKMKTQKIALVRVIPTKN